MVIPGAVLLVILAGVWMLLGNFEAKYAAKVVALELTQSNEVKEKALEEKVVTKRGRMAYWDDSLNKDVMQSFNENLEAALGRFDSNQLRLEAASRSPGPGAFGKGAGEASSLFKLSFMGGYGPMQELFAELELRMPQLVLQNVSISSGTSRRGAGGSLKFEVIYMAWEKKS